MTQPLTLTCLSCGKANRVPHDRLDSGPKCGVCGAPLTAGKVAELNPGTLAKSIKDDLPVVVDFWAPWCAPCRQMAPEFIKAAAQLAPKVRFAKIDTQAFPQVAERHRIQGIPAFILFHNGREVARAAGLRPASDLVAFVKSKVAV
ncbi:thioredoxin TrxC [Phaeovulum sp.]|uniref:thioredoxin TrxC n=1 Tax=Phaeovulum sp. TaxID=2934796 RepID=UPI003564D074